MIVQNSFQDVSSLRQRLSRIALGIRRSRLEVGLLDKPFSSLDYEFYEGGRVYQRKKIILAASGCTAATCTMCPIPNEAFYGLRLKFTPKDFLRKMQGQHGTPPA